MGLLPAVLTRERSRGDDVAASTIFPISSFTKFGVYLAAQSRDEGARSRPPSAEIDAELRVLLRGVRREVPWEL